MYNSIKSILAGLVFIWLAYPGMAVASLVWDISLTGQNTNLNLHVEFIDPIGSYDVFDIGQPGDKFNTLTLTGSIETLSLGGLLEAESVSCDLLDTSSSPASGFFCAPNLVNWSVNATTGQLDTFDVSLHPVFTGNGQTGIDFDLDSGFYEFVSPNPSNPYLYRPLNVNAQAIPVSLPGTLALFGIGSAVGFSFRRRTLLG